MKRYYLLATMLVLLFSRCSIMHNGFETVAEKDDKVLLNRILSEDQITRQPSGFSSETIGNSYVAPSADFNAESSINPAREESLQKNGLITPTIIKDEKDTTKTEPKLEPMVVAGTGLAVAGLGVAAAGIFGAPILFVVSALLLGASALVTALGWRKIKDDPKKFKGEKFAIANYIIIGVIGVLASFYLIWLLFDV